MRKLLNNPFFVGIAALVALYFVAGPYLGLGGKKSGASIVPPTTVAGPVAAAEVPDGSAPPEGTAVPEKTGPAAVRDMLKHLKIPANLRDPFAIPVVAVAEAAPAAKLPPPDFVDTIHLSAVWIQQDAVLVLINGHILQAGEEIGRIKIESATSEGVWLTHWKGRNFVSVGSDFILSTPANQPRLSTSSL